MREQTKNILQKAAKEQQKKEQESSRKMCMIGDIAEGTEVKITAVSAQNQSLAFTTAAVKLEDNGSDRTILYVSPLMKEDKYLGFTNPKNVIETTINGEYYSFLADSITLVKFKDAYYHRIRCTHSRGSINRRQSVRVKFMTQAITQIGENRKCDEATTKDVSCTGIGLIYKGKIEAEKGTHTSITFSSPSNGRNIKVAAEIVRTSYDEEKDNTFLGLKFIVEYGQINNLMAFLQRQEMNRLDHNN